jgi:cell shape-determining protein MreC
MLAAVVAETLTRLLTRKRTVYLVLLLICAGLSLRPVSAVERGLELFFIPTRVITQVVAPVRWWRRGEVNAAEDNLWKRAMETRADAEKLLADEQRAALPTREALRRGRRLIHGEVIGRHDEDLDRVVIRVATSEGIAPGLPVVTGDWYVGRVIELDPTDPSLVHVELVTAGDFRVGARVESRGHLGRPAQQVPRMVVGGLSSELAGEADLLHLEVHSSSRQGSRSGHLFVQELDLFDETYAELALDFALGRLESVRTSKGNDLVRIEPGLDFESGLFQVIVLAPPSDTAEEKLELDTFVADRWIAAKALTRGDLTVTREGRRLSQGRLAGVASGSAVAFGGHLIGRIGEVGWLTSDLLELGDPGLRLAVLARIAGDDVPRPLGEIVSLGRRRGDGRIDYRWTCRVDLPGGKGELLEAELYTGSGEQGVPRGLFVGRTHLPVGRDVHDIVVEQDEEARSIDSMFVWRDSAAPEVRR